MIKAELLAPAGNYEKFLAALRFGADAVYVGAKSFSLRAFADNFTLEELQKATETAHALHKKIYVTANVFAKNEDFPALKTFFQNLEKIGVDAAIVSDVGAVYVAKQVAPNLCLHLSTQANTTNKYAVKFWKELGVSRVVLARELSIAEIAEIHEFVPDMELECFVHGAMCISYSGRCLLSDYLDGRSSNRGACVQACRWQYEIRAVNSPKENGEWLELQQDERGAYVLNSKDLNMLAHLQALENAGVCSFKIEGRMKSAYYLATVINAYRRFMDGAPYETMQGELSAVAHREYTTAYALGKNAETVNYADSQSKGTYLYVADVLDGGAGQVRVEMRNRFQKGDVLEVLSWDETFAKPFVVDKIVGSDGEETDDAKWVQAIYTVNCPYAVPKGAYLRRKTK